MKNYKLKYIFIRKLLSTKGFSLVELLIALFILMMIVFAVTPLLIGSINQIYYAGDKSEAVHHGQTDMEVRIVEKETIDGKQLEFIFDENEDTKMTVPGGMVDIEAEEGDATAWLSGFVPYVPTITLFQDPLPLIEGYDDLYMIVKGNDTEKIEDIEIHLYDDHDSQIDSDYYSDLSMYDTKEDLASYDESIPEVIPPGYDQYGVFKLKKQLTNSSSPYTVELTGVIEGIIDIQLKARFKIDLPHAIAVGGGQRIIASPDVESTWTKRIRDVDDVGEGLGTINDIVWTGNEYVAVASNGSFISLRNRQPLEVINIDEFEEALNSITYGNGEVVAVGESGSIIIRDREGYKKLNDPDIEVTLNSVAWNDDEDELIAVGENGTIISYDGEVWSDEVFSENNGNDYGDYNFYGVTYGDGMWVAVGELNENAVVFTRDNEEDKWEKIAENTAENTLNDVTYGKINDNDENDQFIAIGNEGTVLESENGNETWESVSYDGIPSNKTFYSITWNEIWSCFIVTGEDGLILTRYSNEDDWTENDNGLSGELKGAAIR